MKKKIFVISASSIVLLIILFLLIKDKESYRISGINHELLILDHIDSQSNCYVFSRLTDSSNLNKPLFLGIKLNLERTDEKNEGLDYYFKKEKLDAGHSDTILTLKVNSVDTFPISLETATIQYSWITDYYPFKYKSALDCWISNSFKIDEIKDVYNKSTWKDPALERFSYFKIDQRTANWFLRKNGNLKLQFTNGKEINSIPSERDSK